MSTQASASMSAASRTILAHHAISSSRSALAVAIRRGAARGRTAARPPCSRHALQAVTQQAATESRMSVAKLVDGTAMRHRSIGGHFQRTTSRSRGQGRLSRHLPAGGRRAPLTCPPHARAPRAYDAGMHLRPRPRLGPAKQPLGRTCLVTHAWLGRCRPPACAPSDVLVCTRPRSPDAPRVPFLDCTILMLAAALLALRAPAFSPASHVTMAAALSTPGLSKGRSTRQPAPVELSRRAVVAASPCARPRASGPRLSLETEPAPAPEGRARGYGKEEDKALRLCRTSFGGYPAGAYYELEQAEGLEVAYALVRSDHAALADWSDAEIALALKELKTTPLEVLTDTPIGPFLVLSAISIWRDGMVPWGIAPCREYLDVCAPGGLLSFMYFGLKPPM